MKDSDPYTGDSSAVGTNPTHRRTSSVGVDDATVPIPQTVFKKFYDSMAGWMAGEVAEAEKVGTRSRLGPGARCDSGEGGDRPGETSGRVAPSRAAPKPASWFNPEAFTKEKREWMRQQREAQHRRAASGEVTGDAGITSPFEHFIVCGLPTDADVSGVAASRTEAKRAIIAGAEVHVTAPKGNRRDSYKSAAGETYPARVLWCYPEDVPVPIDDVASFCFPHGVEPQLLERTPSMSGLNDLVYSQRYARADDASFVWALRNQNLEGVEGSAGDERIETLYGVCCYARELVRRRPGMIAAAESAASRGDDAGDTPTRGSVTKHPRGRYLIAADRCYCLISKVPFFSMHFEVLHGMLGVERLERIRACAEELWAEDYENLKTEKTAGSHGTDAAPLVGRKLSYEEPADEDPSADTGASGDASPSDAGSRRMPPTDEELGERSEALRVLCEYRALAIPAPGGEVTFSPLPDLAPVRFVRRVPDEDGAADVDADGEEVADGGDGGDGGDVDRPGTPSSGEQRGEGPDDPTWQSPAVYRSLAARRRRVTGAVGSRDSVDAGPGGVGCAQLWMTPAEESVHMETWTVAALCRTLSLDNVLTALNSVLLERQVAVFSPNLGDLCAVTLALSTTMLRPLRWRSLTLPVMPMTERMTSLLEAPVPFVIGIQRKTNEVRRLCQELTRVNVYKDEVKLGGGPQPQLPRLKELAGVLRPLHDAAREAARGGSYRGPVAEPSERARTAARAFLEAWREYLRALVANLRAYAITEVSAAGEKTSILLKDTWVDSFSKADRSFMRAFGETQMFDWYADVQLRA